MNNLEEISNQYYIETGLVSQKYLAQEHLKHDSCNLVFKSNYNNWKIC